MLALPVSHPTSKGHSATNSPGIISSQKFVGNKRPTSSPNLSLPVIWLTKPEINPLIVISKRNVVFNDGHHKILNLSNSFNIVRLANFFTQRYGVRHLPHTIITHCITLTNQAPIRSGRPRLPGRWLQPELR